MKKIMILLLLLLLIRVQTVAACPASYVEYGLRVHFDDCEDVDGYLVDILFNKNDTNQSLYSQTLNEYYFYYEETIRDIAQNDSSQIDYLNYDQEWISYLAYFDRAYSREIEGECTVLFGDSEDFRHDLDEFKVVILDEYGMVLATSSVYSTNITPSHQEDHMGEMVVFNQTDNTFSLSEYEAQHEINQCGLAWYVYALMVIGYVILTIISLVLIFAETIILIRTSTKVQKSARSRIILFTLNLLVVPIVILFGMINNYALLVFLLVLMIQIVKIIYVYLRERTLLPISMIASLFILLFLYISLGRFVIVF